MCMKRLITVPFERSEPFHMLRIMGVSVPSLHMESIIMAQISQMQQLLLCRGTHRPFNQRNGSELPKVDVLSLSNNLICECF